VAVAVARSADALTRTCAPAHPHRRFLQERTMIVTLAVIVVAAVVAAIALFGVMFRRNEPVYGMAGLFALLTAGVIASVYGVLAHD
jgi:hypothetical protein